MARRTGEMLGSGVSMLGSPAAVFSASATPCPTFPAASARWDEAKAATLVHPLFMGVFLGTVPDIAASNTFRIASGVTEADFCGTPPQINTEFAQVTADSSSDGVHGPLAIACVSL